VSEITYCLGVAGAVGYLFGRAVEVVNLTFISKLFIINEIIKDLSLLAVQYIFEEKRSTSKKLSAIYVVFDSILISLMHKHQLINHVGLAALSSIAVLRYAAHSNVANRIGRANKIINVFTEGEEAPTDDRHIVYHSETSIADRRTSRPTYPNEAPYTSSTSPGGYYNPVIEDDEV
jgi:hypothetical protein